MSYGIPERRFASPESSDKCLSRSSTNQVSLVLNTGLEVQSILDISCSLVAYEVWIATRSFVPGARLAGGLDVCHSAQGVGAVKLTTVKLLTSSRIGRDELHWFVCSNARSKGGILSVDFGFGGAIPDSGGLRLRMASVVKRSLRMVGRRRLHGLYTSRYQ